MRGSRVPARRRSQRASRRLRAIAIAKGFLGCACPNCAAFTFESIGTTKRILYERSYLSSQALPVDEIIRIDDLLGEHALVDGRLVSVVEIRYILAGLEHPNIARFYDAGVDGQKDLR